MTEDLFCDECGELIQGDAYYIGKTKPALVLHNPIFCKAKSLGLNDFLKHLQCCLHGY
ncbi:MAG: hypothetical protein SO076_12200 [Enterococcus faecium]|nr:hypothetical protein [Enterococcus faecium]